jgi:predicted ATPase
MSGYYRLTSINIKGYRPFEDIVFHLNPLQVIVGANGSGKSSLIEFLKFIRDACYQEIPPEIIAGAIGQQIFHKPGADKLCWNMSVNINQNCPIHYQGELIGPVGTPRITYEKVVSDQQLSGHAENSYTFLDFKNGKGVVKDPDDKRFIRKMWDVRKLNQLGLGAITDSTLSTLFNLREFIRGWRFYNSFHIDNEKIRKSVLTSQEPVLREDAGNLSAVLFYLMTEHLESFMELKYIIKMAIPGFLDLNVKARGGPGEVIAFWREKAIDTELSLADLSDGTLRFITWATLCMLPSPPPLICIDEPDLGVHPRTLPILSGLFEKASEKTQLILATHISYFLSQFDSANIAVMKKESGKSVFIRVSDSRTLLDNLEDFGCEELEKMHRTDELEGLA